jgi:hypothetical protein
VADGVVGIVCTAPGRSCTAVHVQINGFFLLPPTRNGSQVPRT